MKSAMIKKSRMPARLDLLQSLSGLLLALFMWLHMFFVASILLGAEAFNRVASMMEGSLFFEQTYPVIVTLVAMRIRPSGSSRSIPDLPCSFSARSTSTS